jgi:hypothetical protein
VGESQEVRAYLENNPDDTEAKESLTALEEARPRRIEFEELDFNLGERWIPTGFMPVLLRTCSMRMYWFIIPKAPMTFL